MQAEWAVLATCHRCEVYTFHAHGESARWLPAFCDDVFPAAAYTHYRGRRCSASDEAVRHLMRVAAGLDSMLLGETDVQHQVVAALAGRPLSGGGDRRGTRMPCSAPRSTPAKARTHRHRDRPPRHLAGARGGRPGGGAAWASIDVKRGRWCSAPAPWRSALANGCDDLGVRQPYRHQPDPGTRRARELAHALRGPGRYRGKPRPPRFVRSGCRHRGNGGAGHRSSTTSYAASGNRHDGPPSPTAPGRPGVAAERATATAPPCRCGVSRTTASPTWRMPRGQAMRRGRPSFRLPRR